ncbi:hypothetical protein O3M35_008480 [Rhynocoris fuscipes]|uniref:Uncharacterized protein n=1 Tax=Rhynocoris fuscipes TaxID=488301 RepID=A0AAW1DC45_9HEMI
MNKDNYKQLSSTDLPTESVNIEADKNQDKSEIHSNQSFLFMPSLFPGTKSSLFVIAKTSTMRKDPWMTIPDRLILNDILKEINLEMMSPLLLLSYPKIHDNNTKYYKQYTNNVRNLPRFFTPKSFVSKPYVTEGTSKRNRKTLSECPENESNANQSPTTVSTQTTPISPGRNCFTFPRNIPRIKKTQTDD